MLIVSHSGISKEKLQFSYNNTPITFCCVLDTIFLLVKGLSFHPLINIYLINYLRDSKIKHIYLNYKKHHPILPSH